MSDKVWRKRPQPPPGFGARMGVTAFHANLYFNRGIHHPDQIETYLAADERLLNDPWLLPDMGEAVARLEEALAAGETIAILGDFDVDGVTATAVLTLGLRDLGGRVVTYLPNRVAEGHGLKEAVVGWLRDQGVSLLVTVDCGISAYAEVELASAAGIDTIVTDHHTLPPNLPRARALIHSGLPDSAYPYQGLTGAGLAFKLVEALCVALGRPWPERMLELAALGTLGDSGPLMGENRFIVRQGLELLNTTQNPGLAALVSRAGLKLGCLDTEALAFGLIPRLNAAGRLGDASLSLDLLLATDLETAEPVAEALDHQNHERQRLMQEGLAQAVSQVEASADGAASIIMVEHESWSPGILGLIAGRLADRYYRPAIAASIGAEVARASARSIPEFDISDALRRTTGPFISMGGHPQAAGFTIPATHLAGLRRELETLAAEQLRGCDLTARIDIDCEISLGLINQETLDFIQRLSPFGQGNQAPTFLTTNVRVVDVRQVGKAQRHLKMQVSHDGVVHDAIAFGHGHRTRSRGDAIDLVYTAGIDHWRGVARPQLTVLDFRRRR